MQQMIRLHLRTPRVRRLARRLVWAAWLLTLALLWSCKDDGAKPLAPLVGQAAPDIKLETLTHERFYLNAHRGKPVVLLFWDTSCQICKRQMVELEAWRQSMGPGRVVVASVCSDPENVDVARRMVAGLKLGFATLLDRGGRTTRAFQVGGFPTTVVVSPDGTVGLFREGYTEPLMQQLRTTVQRYLDAPEHAGER